MVLGGVVCLFLFNPKLHDYFFSLTEAVTKLQFEPSGNGDRCCAVLDSSPRGRRPRTSSERLRSEDKVGADPRTASRCAGS